MKKERLLATLDALAACNATPGHGVTRFSWTETARQAQDVLERELKALGLEPWYDGVGNLHARMPGRGAGPRLLTGSHLDTVFHGGRLDGAFGVVAALEALRSFHEEGYQPACDIEFLAFAEEEGSNFACTCLGSKALAGLCTVDDLRSTGSATETVYDRLVSFGLEPEKLPGQVIKPEECRAFLEVHIEQNAVLETAGCPLGIVTAISGMRLHRITYGGHSDHAASPMTGRRDPMAGFAELACTLEAMCHQGRLPEGMSCTVGEIGCSPNVGIVIPASVTFTIDIRHVDVPVLEESWKTIEELVRNIAARRRLACEIAQVSASGGTRMADSVMAVFEDVARRHGVEPLRLVSGPAHDAASMGQRIPAGLLFVPSQGGISHSPQESTAPEHLALGAAVLEESLRLLSLS